MAEQSRNGYLVLADISGYTSFLAKVELEHAHEILTDLLEVIVDKFKSMLTVSKLEGDAVFAYVEDSKVSRGETLLEMIETTYFAFRQRRDTSNRATTCSCKACQAMPSLELKFFVHHGSFMVQHIAGIRELVGSDVNLAHRLMKNHITERTSWNAYSMFTKSALDVMELKLDDVHEEIETYEHLGDIETVSIDLLPRYDVLAASRKYYIPPEEADIMNSQEFKLSESELWQMLTSVEIFTAIMGNKVQWFAISRPGGRMGVGATNHCAHGKGLLQYTIVDWHPFSYFTGRGVDGWLKAYEMFEITPLPNNEGSLLTWCWKSDINFPRWINKLIAVVVMKKVGTDLFKGLENYIENIQKPTFQPETE